MPTVCSLFLVYVWLAHLHNNSNNNNNNNINEYLYRISYQFF